MSKKTEIAIRKESTSIVQHKDNGGIVIHKGKNSDAVVQIRSKQLVVAGEKRRVDPYQLIRMIKRVTQEIGSYKNEDGFYTDIIVRALRKARGDLANILEDEFGIHWQINSDNGESIFYM